MKRLAELRQNAGLTISQLSQRSGITRQTIYRLEVEEENVANTKTLCALADALGVNVSAFFTPKV